MGCDFKEVPRWAISETLDKVLSYQQKNEKLPFGKLKPSIIKDQFVM